jgi:argininosuccinate lyase
VSDGSTQATDLAEALVRAGMPFRDAYKAAGALVRRSVTEGRPLVSYTPEEARAVDQAFTAETLAVLDPRHAVAAKESAGGTGPRAVEVQLASLALRAEALNEASRRDSLSRVAETISSHVL